MKKSEQAREQAILIVDSANGVYIPQIFAERYEKEILNQFGLNTLAELQNDPREYEFYWDAWNEVLDNFTLTQDGKTYILIQDEDLWLVPEKLAEYWEYI